MRLQPLASSCGVACGNTTMPMVLGMHVHVQVYKDMWRMIAAIAICGIFMCGEVAGGIFAHR